ncbi:hypothetical protein ACHAW5_004087 [Stephanodiscus triporus]|uniref:DDE Tnp4 domain-containing protein n=1 Tax=Stephanodiscus triporus TaxID=2934178 RepID=A0ABD3PWR5_9STRA
MSPITPNMIINAAKSMVNLPQTRNDTFNRRWKSSFGAPPEVCCELWNKIDPYKTMPAGVDPKHILWALLFLTVYDTEHNSAQRLGNVDEKTYRKWSKLFVIAISYLECEVIVWDNRFLGDSGNKALVTLDGTDMPVEMKFAKEFMSHKFKGNGLKYEVGVCIATGHIVWVHGPSRAGESDITLARQAFVSFLNDNEMAVADSGYRGEFRTIKTPDKVHFRSGLEFYDAAVASISSLWILLAKDRWMYGICHTTKMAHWRCRKPKGGRVTILLNVGLRRRKQMIRQ